LKLRGLKSSPGWEERSKKALNDPRWQRKVIDKCSEGRKVERIESVAIVDGHDLGLDKRGPVLNSSNRKCHNFGVNRGALFPRKDGGKGEDVNWTATFTRQGCVVCRREDGCLNHRGRSGEPCIVIIGDGSIPPVHCPKSLEIFRHISCVTQVIPIYLMEFYSIIYSGLFQLVPPI
jgi:hypothetical protein